MLLSSIGIFTVPNVSAQDISQGDFFEYEHVQKVRNGGGAYWGYSETTRSSGQYDIMGVNGPEVSAYAGYVWKYTSTEIHHSISGSTSEDFIFSTDTRKYIDGYDLDVSYGDDPSIWFWISPTVQAGDIVTILDDDFTVVHTDRATWIGWIPYNTICLISEGSGSRNDEYGNFHYSYTDTYYFDRDTGYIIAERYEEHDRGTWEYQAATFDWTEEFTVSDTSYPLSVNYFTLFSAIFIFIAFIVLIVWMSYQLRWMKRRPSVKNIGRTDIKRIRKMEDYPHLPNRASKNLGPFLEDFTRKAILSGGRVAVAVNEQGLQGLAIYHKDVKLGVILCPNYDLNDKLRRFIGAKDFFSEVKHSISQKTVDEYGDYGLKISKGSYNIFETYRVLRLSSIPHVDYDSQTIRLMKEEDLEAVSKISKDIYKVKSKKWLRALIDSGDIGLIAEVDSKVVGFAFATISGTHARFHTLTVIKEMRGRGLGKSLMRARLHIARSLGAEDATVEISDWNLPSLNISTLFGFKPVGSMYVETVRTKRIKKEIVRR